MKWKSKRFESRHISLILYLISLLMPAVCIEDAYWLKGTVSQYTMPGWGVLIMGLPVLFLGNVGWLANPLFMASYRSRTAMRRLVYAIFALAAGLSAHFQFIYWNYSKGQESVIGYRYGYYVWLCSFVWLAGLAIVEYRRTPTS